jgi:hypothetical protein
MIITYRRASKHMIITYRRARRRARRLFPPCAHTGRERAARRPRTTTPRCWSLRTCRWCGSARPRTCRQPRFARAASDCCLTTLQPPHARPAEAAAPDPQMMPRARPPTRAPAAPSNPTGSWSLSSWQTGSARLDRCRGARSPPSPAALPLLEGAALMLQHQRRRRLPHEHLPHEHARHQPPTEAGDCRAAAALPHARTTPAPAAASRAALLLM